MSVDAQFFLSSFKDKCVYNGNSIDATDQTANGNLCAYVDGVNRVWACPAPDKVCWSYSQTCRGADGTSPADDQTFCSSNGDEWCCTQYEKCTETDGQINICWGLWSNPDHNMTAEEAVSYNKEHYSTLPSTTRSVAASTSTSTSAPPTSAAATTTTAAAAATTSAESATTTHALSTGAIAGIAVGCAVGGIALAAAAGFLVWRRRRRRSSSSSATPRWAQTEEAKNDAAVGGGGGEADGPHELQPENSVYEAEGSPGFYASGKPAALQSSGPAYEMPAERYK